MKGIGVTAGAAAGLGGTSQFGPSAVGNAAAIPIVPVVAGAGAAGVGYVSGRAIAAFLGNDLDYDGYTGPDALEQDIRAGVHELASADERVLTSVSNNITHSDNVALAKGKTAIIETMNDGGSEEDATDAMDAALDEYFGKIEENLINHHTAQTNQIAHMMDELYYHEDTSTPEVFYVDDHSAFSAPYHKKVDGYEYTTYDDRTLELPVLAVITDHNETSGGTPVWAEITRADPLGVSSSSDFSDLHSSDVNSDGSGSFTMPDPDSNDSTDVYAYSEMQDAFDALDDARDSVRGELNGFTADVYDYYEPGDIPTEDLLDPVTAATELQQTTGLAAQAAEAAMLGIPSSAGFSMLLETTVDGDTWELNAEIYTNAEPENGFEVGETYDPDDLDDPVYVAYEYIDPETGDKSTDFMELINSFTLLEATGEDGEAVDAFEPESRNQQTSDVSEIEEELAQIREEQIRMQEAAQAGGGGFSFDLDDLTNTQIGAGLVALAVALGIISN